MKRWWLRYRAATRFALIEQGRNRLALVILLFFLPLWILLAYRITPTNPMPFFVRPVGHSIMVHANAVAQITGALQAIALIVGFMMFIATARSAAFDRRLVQAGYPRLTLVLAKVTPPCCWPQSRSLSTPPPGCNCIGNRNNSFCSRRVCSWWH
jgi:hypothetical protein